MIELEQMVKDKSVALVGSASSILAKDCAQQIDAHDIVIRMNLSIPHRVGRGLIGSKTDVWCMGRHFHGVRTPEGCRHILFMKLTRTGDRDWGHVRAMRDVPKTRWPQGLEDDVHSFVGSPPGTGIRLLYWLARVAKPSSVSVFGMDCWETNSIWSGQPAPAHDPAKEKIAMDILMRELGIEPLANEQR